MDLITCIAQHSVIPKKCGKSVGIDGKEEKRCWLRSDKDFIITSANQYLDFIHKSPAEFFNQMLGS